jgi:hypothetical protein
LEPWRPDFQSNGSENKFQFMKEIAGEGRRLDALSRYYNRPVVEGNQSQVQPGRLLELPSGPIEGARGKFRRFLVHSQAR